MVALHDMWAHSEIIRAILYNCSLYGHDTTLLARHLVLPAEVLEEIESRCSGELGIKVWEEAQRLVPIEGLGFHFGKRLTFSVLGAIGPLASSSPTMGAVCEHFAHYFPILTNMIVLDWQTSEYGYTMRYIPAPVWQRTSPKTAELAVQHAMALTLSITAYLLGEMPEVQKAKYAYPLTDGIDRSTLSLARFTFEQAEENSLSFSLATTQKKILTANPVVYQQLQSFCETKLRVEAAQTKESYRVRRSLQTHQSFSLPNLEETAQRLALSSRTLQRRLKEEGTSFQQLLNEHQVEMAKELFLANPHTAIKEVAFSLGFSDVHAFSRTFKRLTGHTPSQFVANKH